MISIVWNLESMRMLNSKTNCKQQASHDERYENWPQFVNVSVSEYTYDVPVPRLTQQDRW